MRARFAATLFCAVAAATLSAAPGPTKKDAELLRKKVAAIKLTAETPPKKTVRTLVTEDELNSFLVFDAGESIPQGVVEPEVSILGTGRVSARAVVGFMVNLEWARQYYFKDLTAQVTRIEGADGGISFTVLDDREQTIAGAEPGARFVPIGRRAFPLAFFGISSVISTIRGYL